MKKTLLMIAVSLVGMWSFAFPQPRTLDDFSSLAGWQIHQSEAVKLDTSLAPGKDGSCLRFDFDFITGAGYGGVNKQFELPLPENFKFTFWVKADAPVNNFEFKIIDESGENVWWVNQRNFEFPREWQKITIKKRHIDFAWGPAEDQALRSAHKIEFIVASSTGGKGSVWIDQLRFEPLPLPTRGIPQPVVSASSQAGRSHRIENVLDKNPETIWRSDHKKQQQVVLDLQNSHEYGGLIIDWAGPDFARAYQIQISQDGENWESGYRVTRGKAGRSYLPLREFESRYIRLLLENSNRGQGYAIAEIRIRDINFTETPEALYREIAGDAPGGYFPRYFYDQQNYWTVVGVNNDHKEALVGEDGAVEVDKSSFSIEPMLSIDGKLLTWNDGQLRQSLEDDYLPIPHVTWQKDDLFLQTTAFADGEAGNSVLYLSYRLKNSGQKTIAGNLYLAIRPFQVNSPWQFLNWPGGTTRIRSIEQKNDYVRVNDNKIVKPLTIPNGFGAAEFDEGDITAFLSTDILPARQKINDHAGYASGALQYSFDLAPGAQKTVLLAVPFQAVSPDSVRIVDENQVSDRLQAVKAFWAAKISTIDFDLPPSGQRLVNIIRSNLAYILINRDGPGIQPGSRSYERSWIRDGALTSSALLKLGVRQEVHDFLNWYAGYQFESGKVPCVVDSRGPDPVPENDSHGQLIFGLYQYYLFTKDSSFLRQNFPQVVKAVAYMDELVAQRSTAEYQVKDPEMRARFGIFPESISHEGYSAKPMHSFWDNFFGMKGYKDAVEIARILGEDNLAKQFAASRDRFRENLYNSIRLSMQKEQIEFIPGCVELGDFDATSTAIAIYPCNELKNLPQPFAQNTFDRYFDFFTNRRQPEFDWKDYTPYEVRLIGTFIYLGQRERAHALIDFFLDDQRPGNPGWNHWAEVVRKGYRSAGFIGDMPHTWVGSDFVSAVRAMFVYEDELDQSLVIGAGLYEEWINKGMSVRGMPTYYGKIDYSIKKNAETYRVQLGGGLQLPPGGIRIRNFRDRLPSAVIINGKPANHFDHEHVTIKSLPATVEVSY